MSEKSYPIRIAYVVHTFDMAGLERCIAHFANFLDRTHFQPMVICLNRNGTAAQWITKDDVVIVELHKRPSNDIRVIGKLSRTLRKYHIDVVQSHNWGTLLETTLACRRIKGIRHVHTEHGQELSAIQTRGIKHWLRSLAGKWALKRIDSVVAVADSVRKRVHNQLGYPDLKIEFIPNGVNIPSSNGIKGEKDSLKEKLGIAKNSLVFGSVGRLVPVKDFANAINAIAKLKAKNLTVDFVIVGDGPEKDSLSTSSHAVGVVDNVHFVGYQENVGDWLRLFDVYVNSSLSEAMSMSILEAMAVGLPVIATDVGDNAQLIDSKDPCGIVIPPADPDRLSEAMERIIANHDFRLSLGRKAKERHASRYSLQSMIRSYESLYFGNSTKS